MDFSKQFRQVYYYAELLSVESNDVFGQLTVESTVRVPCWCWIVTKGQDLPWCIRHDNMAWHNLWGCKGAKAFLPAPTVAKIVFNAVRYNRHVIMHWPAGIVSMQNILCFEESRWLTMQSWQCSRQGANKSLCLYSFAGLEPTVSICFQKSWALRPKNYYRHELMSHRRFASLFTLVFRRPSSAWGWPHGSGDM